MQSGEIPPRLNPPTRTACECHCRWRRLYHGGWHIAFFARSSAAGDGPRRRHDRATARSLFLHPRWLTSLLRESILKGSSMSKALMRPQCRSAAVIGSSAIALLGLAVADRSAADEAGKTPTASPVKHVIVIIGENSSFDHAFGTRSEERRVGKEC